MERERKERRGDGRKRRKWGRQERKGRKGCQLATHQAWEKQANVVLLMLLL